MSQSALPPPAEGLQVQPQPPLSPFVFVDAPESPTVASPTEGTALLLNRDDTVAAAFEKSGATDVAVIKPVYEKPPVSKKKAKKDKKATPGCWTALTSCLKCKKKGKGRAVEPVGTSEKPSAQAPPWKPKKSADKREKCGFLSRMFAGKRCKKNRSVFPETSKLKFVLLGLDNAGKTSLRDRLIHAPAEAPKTTWGFSSNTFDTPTGEQITIYDLGGHSRIRGIWVNYIAEVHGAIFVVDAVDRQRLPEAKQALHDIYGDARLFGKPLLIVANKQDDPQALPPEALREILDLDNLKRLPAAPAGQAQESNGVPVVPDPAFDRPDADVVRDAITIIGAKNLSPSQDASGAKVDESVPIVLSKILAIVHPLLPALQPRIDESVQIEQRRFKWEQEEQKKRVEQYKKEREGEKEGKAVAEAAEYPKAPMP